MREKTLEGISDAEFRVWGLQVYRSRVWGFQVSVPGIWLVDQVHLGLLGFRDDLFFRFKYLWDNKSESPA